MNYKGLIDKINSAKAAYYQTGRSDLTDAEYDHLVQVAEKLGYVETVGSKPVKNIATISHEHPMLSLDKCHSVDEVLKFAGSKRIIAMLKLDGLTISATYQDGVLTRLETRGDGKVGNDIMFHSGSIMNLPKYIDKPGKYVIDGECIIFWNDFETINSKLPASEKYSHARNLAAGSLNQLDPAISKQRYLSFFAWDVIDGGASDSLRDNLIEATNLGFDVVENMAFENYNADVINKVIKRLKSVADNCAIPIDGIVFKFDSISYGKTLGGTAHHFSNAIAYKFKDETYPSTLRSISWQLGKSGAITPVANFDTVDIEGVMVEKSSLHNISIMRNLNLTKDCTVYIKRANAVIPQIEYADFDGEEEFEIPEYCPVCGEPTRIVKQNNSEVLMCENDDCPGRLLGKWETFVGKSGMDINGLSEATLDYFLKRGFINNMMVTIYQLGQYKNQLYKLDGFGKKSVDNLLEAIEASKDVDFVHFLTAFSIPGIGSGQAKLIAKKFPTFGEFMKACDDGYDFSKISGFGEVLKTNIHKWWMLNHVQMIDVAAEVRFKDEILPQPTGYYPFVGKTFVVTGSVTRFKNRAELQKKIESLGGKCSSSVSKSTSYLINNDVDSTSSKNVSAKKFGISIITEEEFLTMYNE